MDPTVEAAQILTRLFEALARQNRKTLSSSQARAISARLRAAQPQRRGAV